MSDEPAVAPRVQAAREVVYSDGDLIGADELDAALEVRGVTVGTAADGTPEYRDVPGNLPLAACHLAVDLQRDPAEFLSSTP